MLLAVDDPVAVGAVEAIRSGDVDGLARLLADHPGLATARIGGERESRSLLHVVTDWPGHFPRGADTVRVLVGAGADVDVTFVGTHRETPLHWAASCDDVDVLDALLDAGATIDAEGAVIAGGTPLLDAVAFGQWRAARRLVERGARVDLFPAATLGLLDRVRELMPATPEEIDDAFWGACHGGSRATAEYLLDRGAQLDRVAWDDLTPLAAAERNGATDLVEWLRSRQGR